MYELSRVLVDDPDLVQHLGGNRREAAVRDCVARVIECSPGHWSPSDVSGDMRFGFGLLVIDGLVVRRVGLAGRFGAELLGDGDVLNPWHAEGRNTSLPWTGRWRVLRNTRMAVLDSDFAMRTVRYPEVISGLFARALRRSRHIAVNMAIVQQPRIGLHMLFWDLADRWGTVHQDGVHVPLQLTHSMLADLVAARRPTVTKALGELAQRSLVTWTGAHWLLAGPAPRELGAVAPISIWREERATART
jgi:hypothetical protein